MSRPILSAEKRLAFIEYRMKQIVDDMENKVRNEKRWEQKQMWEILLEYSNMYLDLIYLTKFDGERLE